MQENEQIVPKFLVERYLLLRGQVSLDLLSLDEEVERISTCIQEASECAALANELREAAKDVLNVAHAQVAARLRLTMNASGKPKSEAQVESEVALDDEHKRAQEVFGEARLDAALWGTLVAAFRTKSSSMRTTADLISSGYISQNYILDRRRKDIRNAVPESDRIPIRGR